MNARVTVFVQWPDALRSVMGEVDLTKYLEQLTREEIMAALGRGMQPALEQLSHRLQLAVFDKHLERDHG